MVSLLEVGGVFDLTKSTITAPRTLRGLPIIRLDGWRAWVREADLVRWLKGRGRRYFGRAVMGNWSIADGRRDAGRPYRSWPAEMTLAQVVAVAGVPGWSPRAVRKLIRVGRLPARIIKGRGGGIWVVRREDLRVLLTPRIPRGKQRGVGLALPRSATVPGRRPGFDGAPCLDGGWAARRARLAGEGGVAKGGGAKGGGGGGGSGSPLTLPSRVRDPE
jgi:hypothetical protein